MCMCVCVCVCVWSYCRLLHFGDPPLPSLSLCPTEMNRAHAHGFCMWVASTDLHTVRNIFFISKIDYNEFSGSAEAIGNLNEVIKLCVLAI